MNYARDFFGPRTTLLMYFRNSPQPLRVTIGGDAELFIGRTTANSAMAPEIDLTPVNAGQLRRFTDARRHRAPQQPAFALRSGKYELHPRERDTPAPE